MNLQAAGKIANTGQSVTWRETPAQDTEQQLRAELFSNRDRTLAG
jgi:hypothetical protein